MVSASRYFFFQPRMCELVFDRSSSLAVSSVSDFA